MDCGSHTMDCEALELVQTQACYSICCGCMGGGGTIRDTGG